MRLAIFSLCVASMPVASARIDLSHQHHLGTDKIAKSVGAAVSGDEGGDTITVDVSATFLGDDGISQVLQSIEEKFSEKSGGRQIIGLEARSNRITGVGAASIFNKILDMTKPTNDTNTEGMSRIESLDMSLNDLDTPDRSQQRNLVKSLEALVEGGGCPSTLRLDCCGLGPAACRSIGKGLLDSANKAKTEPTQRRSLRSLHLGSNRVGDAGAAALAAALRTAPQSSEPLLEVLDLSTCDISDAGCEALALAIRDNPGCVRTLDLSNNRITDDGCVSLALAASGTALANIDLSNNKDITDRGAAALATAIERGAIKSLVIRSCSIKAAGAEALGTALCALASSKKVDIADEEYSLDLSGNTFGIQNVEKKKGSASLLKSKASATTKAYMGFLGKKLRSGLNQAGISGFVPSAESDDDEEELDGDLIDGDYDEGSESGKSGGKCGARAFADAIVGENSVAGSKQISPLGEKRLRIRIGMRRCFLDERAADSLAAAIVCGRDSHNMDISCDVAMNSALDQSTVSALAEKDDDELISDMSTKYFGVLEALRIAQQRAREATEAARARARAENAFGSAFGGGLDDYSDEEDPFFGGGGFRGDDHEGEYGYGDEEYDGDGFW